MIEESRVGWWADSENVDDIADKLARIDAFFAEQNGAWHIDNAIVERFDGRRLVEQVYELLV